MKPVNLLIVTGKSAPKNVNLYKVFWNSFAEDQHGEFISIPHYIELNKSLIRKSFLDWHYKVSKKIINGETLREYLSYDGNFSFWWTTLINEKCNWEKSPCINDAIKMIAFDHWARSKNINNISLNSYDRKLKKSFESWCNARSIKFTLANNNNFLMSLIEVKLLFLYIKEFCLGFFFLFYYFIKRLHLKGKGLSQWKSSAAKITLISYFDNFTKNSKLFCKYQTNYWSEMPNFLKRKKIPVNYLHLYVNDKFVDSPEKASFLINQFNKKDVSLSAHATLDTFLNIYIFYDSFKIWFLIGVKSLNLFRNNNLFLANDINLTYFFNFDFFKSIYGRVAMLNYITFFLFKEAFKEIQTQNLGLYLNENQAWEYSLLYSWKVNGHKKTIGIPHSTIRFWDLRYFFSPKIYKKDNLIMPIPRPDVVAINSVYARKELLYSKYPLRNLKYVEALRYLDLKSHKILRKNNKSLKYINILIVGDYVAENTYNQLNLLADAENKFSKPVRLTLKPHPNSKINLDLYKSLSVYSTDEPLNNILQNFDLVFSGAMTSAAVDAYCNGVPVLTLLDPKILNMSPLINFKNVYFVKNSFDIVNVINNFKNNKKIKKNYFLIDKNLIRWKKLLLSYI